MKSRGLPGSAGMNYADEDKVDARFALAEGLASKITLALRSAGFLRKSSAAAAGRVIYEVLLESWPRSPPDGGRA